MIRKIVSRRNGGEKRLDGTRRFNASLLLIGYDFPLFDSLH